MPVIALLTDFGLTDEYVAVMKGVMLSITPRAQLVDISHQVPPGDVTAAARLLKSACRYFPSDTVFVNVVDPGVGGNRAVLALKARNCFFLAPDNGLLGFLFEKYPEADLRTVSNRDLFLSRLSHTFHGRDIFAPVAAHLANGLDFKMLGPDFPPDRARKCELPRARFDRFGELQAEISRIDHFGNLETSAREKQIQQLRQSPHGRLEIILAAHTVRAFGETFADIAHGNALGLINSRGCLEIAVNGGSAQAVFNVGLGEKVRIRPCDRQR